MSSNNDGIACYTSSISPAKAQAYMMRHSDIPSVFVNPGTLPKEEQYHVGIIIRDLSNNGHETLLTEPPHFPKLKPTFSSDWILPYVDHPVFRNFDFLNMKSVPYLESPKNRPDELCTTCYIQAGRVDSLQAIAFLAHRTDDTVTNATDDQITVQIRTPLLPLSYRPFTLLPTQQLRRFYALQHGLVRLAQSTQTMALISGPLSAGLLPANAYANALYYDQRSNSQSLLASEWNYHSLSCAFSIPRTEKTAGSHAIPALLKALYFLLPGLDATQDIFYDILQPSKYAYVFRLRNIAGWKVIGSVNMVVTDFVAMNSAFDRFIQDSTTHQVISPHIMTMHPPATHTALPILLNTSYTGAHRSLLDSIKDLPADTQTLFKDHTFKHKEVLLLSPQQWQYHIALTGLHMLRKFLDIYPTQHLLQPLSVSDYLLRSLLRSYEPTTVGTITPFSTSDLSSLMLTYFFFCYGLATELLVTENIALKDLRTDLIGKSDTVSISVEQFVHMLKACRGLPADKWCTLFASGPVFTNVKDIAIFIFNRGSNANFLTTHFSLFYPHKLLPSITAHDFKALFLTASNYHTIIKHAEALNAALKADTTMDEAIHALAYALFIGNPKKFPP